MEDFTNSGGIIESIKYDETSTTNYLLPKTYSNKVDIKFVESINIRRLIFGFNSEKLKVCDLSTSNSLCEEIEDKLNPEGAYFFSTELESRKISQLQITRVNNFTGPSRTSNELINVQYNCNCPTHFSISTDGHYCEPMNYLVEFTNYTFGTIPWNVSIPSQSAEACSVICYTDDLCAGFTFDDINLDCYLNHYDNSNSIIELISSNFITYVKGSTNNRSLTIGETCIHFIQSDLTPDGRFEFLAFDKNEEKKNTIFNFDVDPFNFNYEYCHWNLGHVEILARPHHYGPWSGTVSFQRETSQIK